MIICIESGHAFDIIKRVKVKHNFNAVKEVYECRDCGEEYSNYKDISEVEETLDDENEDEE